MGIVKECINPIYSNMFEINFPKDNIGSIKEEIIAYNFNHNGIISLTFKVSEETIYDIINFYAGTIEILIHNKNGDVILKVKFWDIGKLGFPSMKGDHKSNDNLYMTYTWKYGKHKIFTSNPNPL